MNKSLPAGMRERDGYYSWTHPQTGTEYGLGRDRRSAIAEVVQAMAALHVQRPSLVARITGAAMTCGEWLDEFERILGERPSKANTARTRKSQLKRLRAELPADKPADKIDTRDCSRVIESLRTAGKHRTAQALRSFMIDCFDRAIARGIRADNPARVLDAVTVRVRRSRLTVEMFNALYAGTRFTWLRNAMALALVTGQDRDSVRNARFADIHDGAWWNERSKTGAKLCLPLGLRLDAVGLSLEDVVRQCRSTGIVSAYLVHQTERAKGATLGKPIHVDMITRTFSAELARLGLASTNPPTFHELRSLAGRLYRAQGNVSPQELLGHRDPRTTAVYTDARGEWLRVAIRGTV